MFIGILAHLDLKCIYCILIRIQHWIEMMHHKKAKQKNKIAAENVKSMHKIFCEADISKVTLEHSKCK